MGKYIIYSHNLKCSGIQIRIGVAKQSLHIDILGSTWMDPIATAHEEDLGIHKVATPIQRQVAIQVRA